MDHNIIAVVAVGEVSDPIAMLAMQGYEYDTDSGNGKLLLLMMMMMRSFKTQPQQSLGLVMPSTLILDFTCQRIRFVLNLEQNYVLNNSLSPKIKLLQN